MQELLKYLQSIELGPISDTATLESILAPVWHELKGSDEEGMAGYKLRGRMEHVSWEPPLLRFIIERHGGTMLGSTRASLLGWEVNVIDKITTCQEIGGRRVRPTQPKWDEVPVADEIASLITEGKKDERLKWNKDSSVRVQIGKILPQGSMFKQTFESRRKRLRKAIDERLLKAGWKKVRESVYAPNSTDKKM